MNLNSLFAGFVGGLLCSTVFFLVRRALLLPKMLKTEKVKDLSYYGRQPARIRKLTK